MNLKKKIEQFGVVKFVAILICVILFFVFLFQEEIKESKYTKAKMEMFERMKDNKIEDWPSEISNVYDSMILEKKDTLNNEE